MGFEFEFDAKNNVLRGSIKDPPGNDTHIR